MLGLVRGRAGTPGRLTSHGRSRLRCRASATVVRQVGIHTGIAQLRLVCHNSPNLAHIRDSKTALPFFPSRPLSRLYSRSRRRSFSESAAPSASQSDIDDAASTATPEALSDRPLIQIRNATFYFQHPDSVQQTTETADGGSPSPVGAAASPSSSSSSLTSPLFPNLNFTIPASSASSASSREPSAHPHSHPQLRRRNKPETWAVMSFLSPVRSTFLRALRGELITIPPTGLQYPSLSDRHLLPSSSIGYVGFDSASSSIGHTPGGGGGTGTLRGPYLSARYESYRERTDFSVRDFLRGTTDLNPDQEWLRTHTPDDSRLAHVSAQLDLPDSLLSMPVSNLSNGQMRRARIAKALIRPTELLLLDNPFIGLDPRTTERLNGVLAQMAANQDPSLVIAIRPDDAIPEWITHLIVLNDDFTVLKQGPKIEVLEYVRVQFEAAGRHRWLTQMDPKWKSLRENTYMLDLNRDTATTVARTKKLSELDRVKFLSIDGFKACDEVGVPRGEPVVKMEGVQIRYGDPSSAPVLGGWKQEVDGEMRDGLYWTVRQGERWGVFGPNGSGKTTLTALITSDHPQAYAQPLEIFGRHRLPSPGKPGLSVFELQSRIGISSPEVHSFFPRNLTLRAAIESGWSEAPLRRPKLNIEIDYVVDAALDWFRSELNPKLGRSVNMEDEAYHCEGDVGNAKAYLEVLNDQENLGNHVAWADEITFGELSFSAQRVALFLRAFLPKPDLLVLDEAFSGMDNQARDRCMLFLSHGQHMSHTYRSIKGLLHRGPKAKTSWLSKIGRARIPGLSEKQALISICHRQDEVPGCIRNWVCLPDPGEEDEAKRGPRFGTLTGPLSLSSEDKWREIWGIHRGG